MDEHDEWCFIACPHFPPLERQEDNEKMYERGDGTTTAEKVEDHFPHRHQDAD